jgi:hypothetical protein
MQKELGVGDLEIFFRVNRQRVLEANDLKDYELERLKYFIQVGAVSVGTRANPESPLEDEQFFVPTAKGERCYKNILEYSCGKLEESQKYSVFENILHFLKPAS